MRRAGQRHSTFRRQQKSGLAPTWDFDPLQSEAKYKPDKGVLARRGGRLQ